MFRGNAKHLIVIRSGSRFSTKANHLSAIFAVVIISIPFGGHSGIDVNETAIFADAGFYLQAIPVAVIENLAVAAATEITGHILKLRSFVEKCGLLEMIFMHLNGNPRLID